MTTTVALRETATVTLDGTGGGVVQAGPRSHGEVWHIIQASVAVSTAASQPKAFVYVGDRPTQENFADATFIGANNSTTNVAGDIRMPNFVWAVWTGGDPGATATLLVYGTKDVL